MHFMNIKRADYILNHTAIFKNKGSIINGLMTKIISPIFIFEYKNGAITSIIISYQTK